MVFYQKSIIERKIKIFSIVDGGICLVPYFLNKIIHPYILFDNLIFKI